MKGVRLLAKKGLNKEQIRRNPGERERGGHGHRGRARPGGQEARSISDSGGAAYKGLSNKAIRLYQPTGS